MGFFSSILGKKKTPVDFSNVRSGSSSTAPAPGAAGTFEAPPLAAPAAVRTYVVVSGDSLSKIAKREYGDAKKWPVIFEANRAIIKDPDLIHPGQKLTIPPSPRGSV